jgi:chemotaxis regulatin CheY-phosphate phosphatase CheZ
MAMAFIQYQLTSGQPAIRWYSMNTTELHQSIVDTTIDSALSRVARELADIANALERLETLVALIASAATAK